MQRSCCDKPRARASNAGFDNISPGWTAALSWFGHDNMARNRSKPTRFIASLRYAQCHPRSCRLWRAHAQTPVRKRQRAAGAHDRPAEPDQQHKRLIVQPHGDVALLCRIAERDIELADTPRHQGRLSGGHAADRKSAPAWLHGADEIAVHAANEETTDCLVVIRALPIEQAGKRNPVARDVESITDLHLGDPLAAPGGHGDNAEQRDAEAEMRKGGAPGRTR